MIRVKRMTEIETNRPEIGDRISFKLKTGEKVEAMAVKELIWTRKSHEEIYKR